MGGDLGAWIFSDDFFRCAARHYILLRRNNLWAQFYVALFQVIAETVLFLDLFVGFGCRCWKDSGRKWRGSSDAQNNWTTWKYAANIPSISCWWWAPSSYKWGSPPIGVINPFLGETVKLLTLGDEKRNNLNHLVFVSFIIVCIPRKLRGV